MYAFVRVGNQEFKIKEGDFIRTPSLKKEYEIKTSILLDIFAFEEEDKFYMDSSDLKKASVKANVLRHDLRKKVLVFKKKRRKGYRRTKGHRQAFTELQILEIKSPSGKIANKEAMETKNTSLKDKKHSEKKEMMSLKDKKSTNKD